MTQGEYQHPGSSVYVYQGFRRRRESAAPAEQGEGEWRAECATQDAFNLAPDSDSSGGETDGACCWEGRILLPGQAHEERGEEKEQEEQRKKGQASSPTPLPMTQGTQQQQRRGANSLI